MASEKYIPKIRLRMPSSGLASWFTLSRVLINFFVQALFVRLEFSGVKGSSQTSDGLHFKDAAPSSSTSAHGEEGGGESSTGEASISCTVCPRTPVLMVKKSEMCGRARCCGTIIPGRETDEPEYISKITTTQVRTVYDRTGPGGNMVTYECTNTSTLDYNPTGSGSAAGGCGIALPDCGGIETTSDGCEGIVLCGTLPGPGQKCYQVKSTSHAYSKICLPSDLSIEAQGSAELTVDDDFHNQIEESMSGAICQASEGMFVQPSWEFKRLGYRYPVHIVLEITERGIYGGVETITEEIITFDANTNTGVYTMDIPPEGDFTRITKVDVYYGKLP